MRIAHCYNCGSHESTFYAEENGFSLVKCASCGLLYLRERPDDSEISQAHKQGRHTGRKELAVTGRFDGGKIATYLTVLEDMFRNGLDHQRTWLDVGCGHGEFMLAVQQFSRGKVIAKGTEPNEEKQKSARERGLDVGYLDIESHEAKYDVVSLLNVYSHLPDPPAFLRSVKKLLNRGGELVLQTGDTADFSSDEHPRPFYLPDHLSFASETIVTDILRRLDFEILSVSKYPYLSMSPKAIAKEVVKVFLPRYQSRIKIYPKWKRYSQADMYIRARVAS